MRVVHVQWTGPHTVETALAAGGPSDYGVYQVCGHHPTYGLDALLYIGKAQDQSFARRLGQHALAERDNITGVRLGRLAGSAEQPSDTEWGVLIAEVEALLIFAHKPSWNSKSVKEIDQARLRDLHILNWGQFGTLLPEVSGARHSDRYWEEDGYRVFSE